MWALSKTLQPANGNLTNWAPPVNYRGGPEK